MTARHWPPVAGRACPSPSSPAIDHLERQRKELDDAILFLRNARRRLDEAGRPTGSS
jgi:hypothetical protein